MSGLDSADRLTGDQSGIESGDPGNDSLVGSGGAEQLFGDEGDGTINSRDSVNGNDSLDRGPHVNGDTAITDATERSIVGFPQAVRRPPELPEAGATMAPAPPLTLRHPTSLKPPSARPSYRVG